MHGQTSKGVLLPDTLEKKCRKTIRLPMAVRLRTNEEVLKPEEPLNCGIFSWNMKLTIIGNCKFTAFYMTVLFQLPQVPPIVVNIVIHRHHFRFPGDLNSSCSGLSPSDSPTIWSDRTFSPPSPASPLAFGN